MILSFVKIRSIRFVGVELFLASNSNHLFGINKIMCSKMTKEIVRRIVQKKREAEREREKQTDRQEDNNNNNNNKNI